MQSSAKWDARAAKRVGGWQEQAYGALAEELGLGWRPNEAYERLAVGLMPIEFLGPERFRQILGKDLLPDASSEAELQAEVASYRARYVSEPPPTPFEEPNLFGMLCELVDTTCTTFARVGYPLLNVRVATLPSGRVHALTRRVGGDSPPVILVEQGLLHFFYRFCRCIGSALNVELSPGEDGLATCARLLDPGRLGRMLARDGLQRVLGAYVIEGNAQLAPPVELAPLGAASAMLFLRPMELFVIGHEVMHVAFGHLVKGRAAPAQPQRWEQEHDCDTTGAAVTLRALHGHPEGAVLAGCDLALVAFAFLERTIALLRTAAAPEQAPTEAYPPLAARRKRLVSQTLSDLADVRSEHEIAEIRNWLRLTSSVCEMLWDDLEPTWRKLHEAGWRPSPRWGTVSG